jgi:outer membrane protein OmpA-like peptidoglycan-associated protein
VVTGRHIPASDGGRVRVSFLGLGVLGLALACGGLAEPPATRPDASSGTEPTQTLDSAPASGTDADAAWAGQAAPPGDLVNLTSFAAGARIFAHDDGGDNPQLAGTLLDERLTTNWTPTDPAAAQTSAVIELASRSRLEQVELFLAGGWHYEALAHAPREILVQASSSAQGPWVDLTRWAPTATPSRSVQPLPKPVEAKFVRIQLAGNRDPSFAPFLTHLGVRGVPLETVAPPSNLEGSYHGGWLLGAFSLFKTSAGFAGCFQDTGLPISVTVEGNVTQLRWNDGETPTLALLVQTPQGGFQGVQQSFPPQSDPGEVGLPLVERQEAPSRCAKPSEKSDIERDLETLGRARVYRILFDFGSDKLRPESGAALDEIADILRRHPEWSLQLEGHTDSVGSEAANLDLSQRRAASATRGLEERGIEAARLRPAGYGEARPVADNTSPVGRAENRRVELVR